jgi:hypothetical protein
MPSQEHREMDTKNAAKCATVALEVGPRKQSGNIKRGKVARPAVFASPLI